MRSTRLWRFVLRVHRSRRNLWNSRDVMFRRGWVRHNVVWTWRVYK